MLDLSNCYGDELHDALRVAAQAGPVAVDGLTGALVALRHADVDALGRDDRLVGVGLTTFDLMGITSGPLRDWYGSLMFTNEGAAHRRLRMIVQKAFTPRSVEMIRADAGTIASTCAATVTADGGGDLFAAFSLLPIRVICRLIGVPDNDVRDLVEWADALSPVFGFMTPEQVAAATAALGPFEAYVDQLLVERQSAPTEDLVTRLLVAEAEGQKLTHGEVRTMVANLIVGGHDTTGSQLGCSFLTLLRHAEQTEVLPKEPALVRAAIEETMRFEPSIPGIPRTVVTPVEVGGQELPAGALVILSTAAANREPGVWAAPDRFELTRFTEASTPRLMSFGIGVHYCLGAAVARMTLEEAVRVVFAEGPALRFVGDPWVVPWRQVLGRSPAELPVEVAA